MRWQRFFRDVERLLVFVLLVVLVVSVAAAIASDPVEYPGTKVAMGDCYQAPDGWSFCNTMWVKTFGYVSVMHDGSRVDLLIIPLLGTRDYRGHTLRYTIPYLYVTDP